MNYKNQWLWATGAGYVNNQMFSLNYTQGLETSDGESTGDYYKLGEKYVHL